LVYFRMDPTFLDILRGLISMHKVASIKDGTKNWR
jgi:hypothetical protein